MKSTIKLALAVLTVSFLVSGLSSCQKHTCPTYTKTEVKENYQKV